MKKEQKMEQQPNTDSTADNSQVSPTCPKPIVSGCFSVGMKFPIINGGYLKIMAFVDGYYMARFKGCVPFCCKQDELIRRMLVQNSR